MSVAGGSILDTQEKVEWVLANYSSKNIVECENCERKFFSARLQSLKCYGCWYGSFMNHASDIYSDVTTAISEETGTNAEITQTGGMCLAIHIEISLGNPDIYLLLTDREDALSLERNEEDGWALGYYDYTTGCGDNVPLSDEDHGMLCSDSKTVDEAVKLVLQALTKIKELRGKI